jgi:hypothetical protein
MGAIRAKNVDFSSFLSFSFVNCDEPLLQTTRQSLA